MSRRAFHFASLLLLLASLGAAAEQPTGCVSGYAAPYVRVLMAQQQAAKAAATNAMPGSDERSSTLELSAGALGVVKAVWGLRAPVAAGIVMHAVTGSGL